MSTVKAYAICTVGFLITPDPLPSHIEEGTVMICKAFILIVTIGRLPFTYIYIIKIVASLLCEKSGLKQAEIIVIR